MIKLHLFNRGILVPKAPLYVFCGTRHQVYYMFDPDDINIVNKQVHIQHIPGPIDWHINIYCNTTCYVLTETICITINHSLLPKVYFTMVSIIFAFQEMLICRSCVSSD